MIENIDQITEKVLQDLIDNSVLESKTIEYKQSLPSDSDSDKKEFLADVSSFANAIGGNIIYGIVEDRNTGMPKTLDGLTIKNIDQEIIRLENIIRNGIEPRILGVVIKHVNLSNSNTAIIIKIPKSYISPHRVSFKGHDKFYSRSTNGKYPLDVAELRIAFNLSETITERIRKFREDRISKIFANETPVLFHGNAKIVLHLIPIISFNPVQCYDIDKIASNPAKMNPISSPEWEWIKSRYNFDGFLKYSGGEEDKCNSYVQLFKNGIIEAVNGRLLHPHPNDDRLLISSSSCKKKLIESLSEYLSVLKALNVELPIFIFLTLLGVKGYLMYRDMFSSQSDKIDRDILLLPETIVENYDVEAESVLRPCFDSIWNACGFPHSLNYDEAGK